MKIKTFISSILSGLLIAIGCAIYLSCENKLVGSLLFSIALFVICMNQYNLFTGKIGYLLKSATFDYLENLLIILLGNIISVCFFGSLIAISNSSLVEKALVIINVKSNLSILESVIRAMFCGILMYLAVDIFKNKKSVLSIFLCVPTFILSGFEHSIADFGYWAMSGFINIKIMLPVLCLIILGNSLGSWIIPTLESFLEDK